MSLMNKSIRSSSLCIGIISAVATVGLIANTHAQQPVTRLHGSVPKVLPANGAGTQDAIFRNGFGSSVLSFSPANPQPNLVDVYSGAMASGDIDRDGDVDLFISGIMPQRQAKLYLNDGSGNFSEIASPFPVSGNGQAIFKDLDGDADLDFFYSGSGNSNQLFANVYLNNGSGGFTQINNPTLPRFLRGAALADVDNDGDQDLLVAAQISTGALVTDLFLNNGSAVFTAQGNAAFTAVRGAANFIDSDNDGDSDVIISGLDVNNASSTKLYRNDGSGSFALNTESTFAAIAGENIDVADTDNDGDLDVLLNGSNRNLLYVNNGFGVFTEVATSLQQVARGQNCFADLDNDGDQDLLITGDLGVGPPSTLYENKGANLFTQAAVLGSASFLSACAIADFSGDGLKDIVIQDFDNRTNVHWNTSTNSN